MRRQPLRLIILIQLVLLLSLPAFGQDTLQQKAKSSVFKDYKPPGSSQVIRPSDLEYQLWEGLMIVREANDGDPAAQHELGLRYLLGKGFPIDTVKAAYWIHKAADQNMSIAQYNYGVFLDNGWGVEWNPFEAYLQFKAAAKRQLPEAEFAMGLSYTDNLVVTRDWAKAYKWLKAAADAKYEPAHQVLIEFVRKGIPVPTDTTAAVTGQKDSSTSIAVKPAGSLEPVFLDFGSDTATHVDDLTLLNEAFHEGNSEFRKALGVSKLFGKGDEQDSTGISMIIWAAGIGSPEDWLCSADATSGESVFRRTGFSPPNSISVLHGWIRARRRVCSGRLCRKKGLPRKSSHARRRETTTHHSFGLD